MIIDGRAIAGEILREVQAALPEGVRPVVRAVALDSGPATRSYLRIKAKAAQEAGMVLEVVELPAESTTQEVITAIEIPGAHAVIVQLPLPEQIELPRVLASIPVEKDADVLSPEGRARFARARSDALIPPVAGAVAAILLDADVDVKGKNAVVVGSGYLVGEPVAEYLRTHAAHVSIYDEQTFDDTALKNAEIIVSGTGVTHLIKPHMLSEGVVLIDAGTSEQSGVLKGDIDPACASVASVYTPVPGGVGPIAVACLFKNVSRLL